MSKPYKKYERLPTQFDDENAVTAFEMLVNDWNSSLDSTTTGIGFQRSLEEQGECFIEFGNCVKPIHSNFLSSLNPTLFTFDGPQSEVKICSSPFDAFLPVQLKNSLHPSLSPFGIR